MIDMLAFAEAHWLFITYLIVLLLLGIIALYDIRQRKHAVQVHHRKNRPGVASIHRYRRHDGIAFQSLRAVVDLRILEGAKQPFRFRYGGTGL